MFAAQNCLTSSGIVCQKYDNIYGSDILRVAFLLRPVQSLCPSEAFTQISMRKKSPNVLKTLLTLFLRLRLEYTQKFCYKKNYCCLP